MSEYIAKCYEVVGISGKTLMIVEPDGFCAWGKRKECGDEARQTT